MLPLHSGIEILDQRSGKEMYNIFLLYNIIFNSSVWYRNIGSTLLSGIEIWVLLYGIKDTIVRYFLPPTFYNFVFVGFVDLKTNLR